MQLIFRERADAGPVTPDPRNVVAIDFETYVSKEYKVSKTGSWAYTEDPRFECYQVALCGVDREGLPIDWCGDPKEAPWDRIEGCVCVSHNALFDKVVAQRVRQLFPAWKVPRPSNWHCTADMASYLQAPRGLKEAARALLGSTVDKSYRDLMEGRHFRDLTPEERDTVRQAGRADAKACYDLWVTWSPAWPIHERMLAELTSNAAERGVHMDWERVERALASLQRMNWEAEQAIPWVEDGAPPLSMKAVRQACRERGIPAPASLAQDSDECARWEDEFGEKHPFVAAMRIWRRTNIWSTTTTLAPDDNYTYPLTRGGRRMG